ncbi:fibronectin type III domain-containing protein [Candidatus Sumerlaeota bacterium]|nr:fibronectin type III domain-containing protein [Candidatus Sumerlaeota bacterium]
MIPSLSAPSVKNGGELKIQAIVRSAEPVVKVEARIERKPERVRVGSPADAPPDTNRLVSVFPLAPAPTKVGGAAPNGGLGFWETEWKASGLEEGHYVVALTATDASGHSFEDRSLSFSDPVAGQTEAGDTDYPMASPFEFGSVDVSYCGTGDVYVTNFTCALVDEEDGYLYLGSSNAVKKIDLGDGPEPPQWVGTLVLFPPESGIECGVIDPTAGFAYFGTRTSPAYIVKVALGMGDASPTRVGSAVISDVAWFQSAVIDPAAGYAYFGGAPGVAKVELGDAVSSPTHLNSLDLSVYGGCWGPAAAIDTTNGFAYFGGSGGDVLKVGLPAGDSTPTLASSLALEGDTLGYGADLTCLLFDAANRYLYAGWADGWIDSRSVNTVLKIAPSDGVSSPALSSFLFLDEKPVHGFLDAAGGRAYFTLTPSMSPSSSQVLGILLDDQPSTPSVVGQSPISNDDSTDLSCSAFYDAGGLGYWLATNGEMLIADVAEPVAPLREIGATWLESDQDIACGVVDETAGYAYFGTNTTPGTVVKVALGDGSNPAVRVGSLRLNTGENLLSCAAIDATGYAYFGTATNPPRVIKVALGTDDDLPSRIGAVTLDVQGEPLTCALIDPASGYAYFGLRGAWASYGDQAGVVKVALGAGDSPPTQVGAAYFPDVDNWLLCGVIDTLHGYAYFGTAGDGNVVKVALGAGDNPPVKVGSCDLGGFADYPWCAIIDVPAGYAYFGRDGYTNPTAIVKIALGEGSNPPSQVGALSLGSYIAYNDYPVTAVLDSETSRGLFGVYGGDVLVVDLGEGSDPPAFLWKAPFEEDEQYLCQAAVIDETNRHAFFPTYTGGLGSPPNIVKVALGDTLTSPARICSTPLLNLGSQFSCAVLDSDRGYIYFGTETAPGRVVKMTLGGDSEASQYVATLELEPGEDNIRCAAIDTAAGYAYFGTDTSPGHIVKVALGDGPTTPSRVGTLTFGPPYYEEYVRQGVLDVENGYGYFATNGRIVKAALGESGTPPTCVASIDCGYLGYNERTSGAVIDTESGHAYFTYGSPAYMGPSWSQVLKVALGDGDDPPTVIGSAGQSGVYPIRSAAIDVARGCAYFGTGVNDTATYPLEIPATILKIGLGEVYESPTLIGSLTLPRGYYDMSSAAFDGDNAYFAGGEPGLVVKVGPGTPAGPPVLLGGQALASGEDYSACAAIDPDAGVAWFGTHTAWGGVVKAALSLKDSIHASRIDVPETAEFNGMRFYSHHAGGRLRLALYADGPTTRTLLWESDLLDNTVEESWLSVPVSDGTPGNLSLPTGTYWLAFQTDNGRNAPGYRRGIRDSGFRVPAAFGSFPTEIPVAGSVSTQAKWSAYLVYNETSTVAPTNPGAADVATDRIVWTWTDNSTNEDGFRVWADPGTGSPSTLIATTDANVSSCTQTSLSTNTLYTFQAASFNLVGESTRTTEYGRYTHAAVPCAPILGNPSTDGFDAAIATSDSNSSQTEYAIHCETTVQWVGESGTLGTGETWRTADAWSTVTISGLAPDMEYSFRAKARNGNGVETALGAAVVNRTLAVTSYTVVFLTDGTPGASLSGTTTQVVEEGGDCTPVGAIPPPGHSFFRWTRDGEGFSTANPLTVTNVTEDMTLVACFGSVPSPDTGVANWDIHE